MPHSNAYYEFGPYRLNLAQRVLTRGSETVALTPKATEILIMLVTNAGHLIEKDELLKEVWPDTFVEESNLTQNIFTLRRALGDERADPKYIETVARRGYRFIASVTVHDDYEQDGTVAGIGSSKQTASGDLVSVCPVVAVLPFINATGDSAVEYLADGLTDHLINNLSRVSKLRVMSRSAAFRYKTTELNPQLVGRELGVNAVLVGTLNSRPVGLSIGVELVEVATGWQLWGESFACELKNLLEVQETITRQLLSTLKLKLTGDEERRVTARYTESAEAYQAYLEGRYHWSHYTRKGIEKAIGHFHQAIELDPNYALAYAGIVDCYLRLATNYLPPEDDTGSVKQANGGLETTGFSRLQESSSAEGDDAQSDDLPVGHPEWGHAESHDAEAGTKHMTLEETIDRGEFGRARDDDTDDRRARRKSEGGEARRITGQSVDSQAEDAAAGCVESDRDERLSSASQATAECDRESDPKVRLRFEWDWKGAERELRRANELKTDYPGPHQWYAAYGFALAVYIELAPANRLTHRQSHQGLRQFFSVALTPSEEVQIFCTIAREQIEVGNYEAGCLMLRNWWTPGELPNTTNLNPHSAADLLFTAGSLAGCLSSTGRMRRGQRHAESLLCGAMGIFEHVGAKRRAAECRIELALSYYRQGLFEPSRLTLLKALDELDLADIDLRSVASIRLAVVERHAGHVHDSVGRLHESRNLVELNGPLVTGRYHHELATSLKDLAIAENQSDYFESVIFHFRRAVYEFVAIGHHRYAAVVENNLGFLFVHTRQFRDAEAHLVRARKLFNALNDKIRTAQVDDSLARLGLATDRLEWAQLIADRAINALEETDEEALLAEALTTKGAIFCKANRFAEARATLEGARRIAERCGDSEGAGRALLLLVEHMWYQLSESERNELATRMRKLLEYSQQRTTRVRLQRCLELLLTRETY